MIIKRVELRKKEHGCKTYSLVRKPAVQIKGMLMSEHTEETFEDAVIEAKVFSAEKMQIIAPLIIPNKMIMRSAEEIGEDSDGFVYWTADMILKEQKSLMQSINAGAKLKLDHESETQDAYLLECWTIRHADTDIACDYFGKNTLPVSTLMTVTQITNPALWEEVKAGLCGISLEGTYTLVTKSDSRVKASELECNEDDEVDAFELDIIADAIEEYIEEVKNKLKLGGPGSGPQGGEGNGPQGGKPAY